jgi:Phospholipase_D-nuclease N-terminal
MSAALPLAYDYPLLGVFWTMLWFTLWILWIFLVIRILIDVFRSQDMGGWAKAGWTVFIVILPLLGILVYLIARGKEMAGREMGAAADAEQARQSYIKSVAGSPSAAEEVTKLPNLRDQGVLSEQEFQAQKAKVLA